MGNPLTPREAVCYCKFINLEVLTVVLARGRNCWEFRARVVSLGGSP
jgi:hypothetical protein